MVLGRMVSGWDDSAEEGAGEEAERPKEAFWSIEYKVAEELDIQGMVSKIRVKDRRRDDADRVGFRLLTRIRSSFLTTVAASTLGIS